MGIYETNAQFCAASIAAEKGLDLSLMYEVLQENQNYQELEALKECLENINSTSRVKAKLEADENY